MPAGFEPARAEPNGLAVHLLNHSDIWSVFQIRDLVFHDSHLVYPKCHLSIPDCPLKLFVYLYICI